MAFRIAAMQTAKKSGDLIERGIQNTQDSFSNTLKLRNKKRKRGSI